MDEAPSGNKTLLILQKYCSNKERTLSEVQKKLYGLGVDDTVSNHIIQMLIEKGFLNEKRFSMLYAVSKFRQKKWGRRKIISRMKKLGLPEELITIGIEEIQDKDYIATLDKILTKKHEILISDTRRKSKTSQENAEENELSHKLMNYAIQKGYEQELIMNRIGVLKLRKG